MEIGRARSIDIDKKVGAEFASAAAREALGVEPRKVKYLGGGSFGRAFGVSFDGGEMVVKLLVDGAMMRKETHDLSLLGSACSLPMPKILFCREADASVPVACYGMERIDGKSALTSLSLQLGSKAKKERFADEVTTALHTIHTFTADKYGDTMSPKYDDWQGFYRPFAESIFAAARQDRIFSREIIDAMKRAMDVYDIIFSEKASAPCLIHGDLNVANIMYSKGRVSGFIDPLNSMYADREYDLFQFRNLWGERFKLVGSYVSKYGASEMLEYKLAFYGLFNEIWCSIKVGYVIPPIMKPLVKRMDELASKLR